MIAVPSLRRREYAEDLDLDLDHALAWSDFYLGSALVQLLGMALFSDGVLVPHLETLRERR